MTEREQRYFDRCIAGFSVGFLACAEIMRGVDQRDMRQRLREIAGLAAGTGIVLFGQQAEIVGDRDHAVEQRLRLVDLARQHIGVRQPKRAGEERAFDRLLSRRTSRGSCRSTKPSRIRCFSIAASVPRTRGSDGGRKPTDGSSRMLASSIFEP